MAPQSFEATIAGLDRASGPPEKILQQAAQILGLDLADNLTTSSKEVRFKTTARSPGFKEQWLLRWLLKNLNASDAKGEGSKSERFVLLPQFWSLLLSLTCRIADEACLEILLERKFFPILDESVRFCLSNFGAHADVPRPMDGEDDSREPPTKRRRLSPPVSAQPDEKPSQQANLVWVMLQAACRCVDLLASPSMLQRGKTAPKWTAPWNDQASLLGGLLQAVAMLASKLSEGEHEQQGTLSQVLDTVLSFWQGDSAATRAQSDDPNRAFVLHCLEPTLVLLDLLKGPNISETLFNPAKKALERLIALHLVFPFRAMFNERYAKKWRNVKDTLLYEHLENVLKGFKERVMVVSDKDAESNKPQNLSWVILDIAARSIPASDLRKRQQEQPWLDSLFICLVHVLWPRIPQITSTGVVQKEISTTLALRDRESWVAPMEKLIDVALGVKLRISLPISGYILSAIFASEEETCPWSLLAKIVRLDVNILIPSIGLSSSDQLLKQVLERTESDTVPNELYKLIRDDILLALLRAFARARNLDGFMTIWQQGLGDAIRVRYTTKYDPDTIPAVLVWDDDDIFDEFKSLALVHAPPRMGQRLLGELVEQLRSISQVVGSTADVFAKLAIFSALLEQLDMQEASFSLDNNQLVGLLEVVADMLPKKSDYQAQRWRLWRLVRLLLPHVDIGRVPYLEELVTSRYSFISLHDLQSLARPDESRKRAATFLECLECFSLLIELAIRTPALRKNLEAELNQLAELLLQTQTQTTPGSLAIWNGRSYDCTSRETLVSACVGRLLQRPEIFSTCPTALKSLMDTSFELVTKSAVSGKAEAVDAGPNLQALLKSILKDEEVINDPILRETLLLHVTEILNSTGNKPDQLLLQSLPIQALKKSQLRKVATAAVQRLTDECRDTTIEGLAEDMNLLIRCDSVSPKTGIDYKDWRQWIGICDKLSKSKEFGTSSSSWPAVNMINHTLSRVWAQALASQDVTVLSDIVSWIKKTLNVAKDEGGDAQINFLALEIILGHACQAGTALDNLKVISSRKLEKLQKSFLSVLKSRLDRILHDQDQQVGTSTTALFQLKLVVSAARHVGSSGNDEELRKATESVRAMLGDIPETSKNSDSGSSEWQWRTKAALQSECMKFLPLSEVHPNGKEEIDVAAALQKLTSSLSTENTNADLLQLVTAADNLVVQAGPAAWSAMIDSLYQQHQGSSQLVRPIVIASVIAHTTTHDILQNPQLATTLADLACMRNLLNNPNGPTSLEELCLCLDNARTVLESHPLIINQATLDNLLANICTIASSAADDYIVTPTTGNSEVAKVSPHPSDIYNRLCAVVGAILARHRRRISDRYHLLLPVLQTLLRCLFWPGLNALHDNHNPNTNSSTAVSVSVSAFGTRHLPNWMRTSQDPLSPSSAEHFSRLLSSICNPTVSAARSGSSKKRGHSHGHNDLNLNLNDETKRARLLAGQHMQYLVMEYARCTLDGLIVSSVKEKLMPGKYSVMGAMERDLLRALNAALDPSGRAIFKGLYDDWTRYGKWDKS
ncbi:hypothetical protein ABEF92_004908 [Exophiala dermatitidis]|uniref:Nucleolar 27S pre-rRNA processing Urb2/Npa2 C-terminal domain-containing protein n=1 Tax=Exophiala dermatitidis (strain ATCC 34100 / CBS 525.76 / NIH/UT8656) TaxID=858893 RepID=H6BPK4_EXODN|nr:uncharacterized protein HMPREF1120_01795 [Exophiala dermatitidis NIH/UT8656]EHY53606.1 hypothetical protein HMPREF1120_01795 [Exophiala dermatitidis NIH/UT8656]